MKMSPGELAVFAQEKKGEDGSDIKCNLHWHGRPAGGSSVVVQSEPGGLANPAQATAVQQTTHPSEDDPHRRDQSEPVTRNAGVSDHALGNFDGRIPAKQRAENGFARGELQPHIRRAEMQPAFGQDINNLRPKKRAEQPGHINADQPVITPSQSRPKTHTYT